MPGFYRNFSRRYTEEDWPCPKTMTAGMKWLERNVDRRVSPGEVLPGAESLVCLALNYYPGDPARADEDDYKIARYAWNEDYQTAPLVFLLQQFYLDP